MSPDIWRDLIGIARAASMPRSDRWSFIRRERIVDSKNWTTRDVSSITRKATEEEIEAAAERLLDLAA